MVTNECGGWTWDAGSDTWRPLTAEERREIARWIPEYQGRASAGPIIHRVPPPPSQGGELLKALERPELGGRPAKKNGAGGDTISQRGAKN
jgi:hypothetical protein